MCVAQVVQPQVNPDLTIAQVEQITAFTWSGTGAIYRTKVCTEVCAGAIYPNKVVSDPATINNGRRRPRVGQALLHQLVRTDIGAEGTTKGRKQNRNKSKSWKIGEIKYRQNITCWNCKQNGHFQNQCSKLIASRDKVVNMAAEDSDDALVCCVENTVEDHIMDSGASFYATYCKEELERFKLRSSKVRLADDKTIDMEGVGDAVLKTSFGTSWTLKDVRYFLGLKRRLISVGQLDEEGYHVGFRDQQWKVTKGSLVVARGNKRENLYIVDVHPEGIGVIINGSGSAAVWFREAEESFIHNVSEDKETTENGIVMLKMVSETPIQFGVAERLSRTFRAESTGIRVEAPKMLWADSVSTTYLIYRIPYVLIGLRIPEEEWQGKEVSLAHLRVFGCDSFVKVKVVCGEAMKCTFIGSGSDEMRYNFRDTKSHHVIRSRDITFADSIYGARSATDSSSLMKPIQKSQVVLVDIPENLVENDSIVAEHGLSSKITQSPGGSSDTSEGSENSGSFKDSGRSNEEYSEDGASSKEGSFETPHVRRSTRESRAPVRYSPSANYLLLTENGELESKEGITKIVDVQASWAERKPRVQIEGNFIRTDSSAEAMIKDRCSKKQVLGYVLTVSITTVEWESGLQKSITIILRFAVGNVVRIWISEGYLYRKSLSPVFGRFRAVTLFMGRWFQVYRRLLEMKEHESDQLLRGDC
ncbi:retrovirus-related pol polyprotein from transposon TNT 1-94 [Tanacetum coccineum]